MLGSVVPSGQRAQTPAIRLPAAPRAPQQAQPRLPGYLQGPQIPNGAFGSPAPLKADRAGAGLFPPFFPLTLTLQRRPGRTGAQMPVSRVHLRGTRERGVDSGKRERDTGGFSSEHASTLAARAKTVARSCKTTRATGPGTNPQRARGLPVRGPSSGFPESRGIGRRIPDQTRNQEGQNYPDPAGDLRGARWSPDLGCVWGGGPSSTPLDSPGRARTRARRPERARSTYITLQLFLRRGLAEPSRADHLAAAHGAARLAPRSSVADGPRTGRAARDAPSGLERLERPPGPGRPGLGSPLPAALKLPRTGNALGRTAGAGAGAGTGASGPLAALPRGEETVPIKTRSRSPTPSKAAGARAPRAHNAPRGSRSASPSRGVRAAPRNAAPAASSAHGPAGRPGAESPAGRRARWGARGRSRSGGGRVTSRVAARLRGARGAARGSRDGRANTVPSPRAPPGRLAHPGARAAAAVSAAASQRPRGADLSLSPPPGAPFLPSLLPWPTSGPARVSAQTF